MAHYVIGDVQGCDAELAALLQQCAFNPEHDQLWLVGDLVNRGPDSLAVLRRIRALGDAARCVLGNHDLHLLALAYGHGKKHRQDTLDDILAAPDHDELIHWLCQQPLLHQEAGWMMVHAGLWPEWDESTAIELASEISEQLQTRPETFLAHLYGNHPDRWSPHHQDMARWRFGVNVMTRMRFIHQDGRLDLAFKGERQHAPASLKPWFEYPSPQPRQHRILCGHWSALGLWISPEVVALDTGCIWGQHLSAYRLEDGQVFQQAALPQQDISPC
jgi:bis(5'-nucleosyl)-tetraphosphatase (symmetrical)